MTTYRQRKANAGEVTEAGPERFTEAVLRPVMLRLSKIEKHADLQMRRELDEDHVRSILGTLEDGGKVKEPVIVYRAQASLWLADGYHRLEAHRRAGREKIKAVIVDGAWQDAVVCAEEANLKHGLSLSTAEKKAIFFARLDRDHQAPEGISWRALSDGALASELGIDKRTVGRWFEEYATKANALVIDRSIVFGRDGREYRIEPIQAAQRERHADNQGNGDGDDNDDWWTPERIQNLSPQAFDNLLYQTTDKTSQLYQLLVTEQGRRLREKRATRATPPPAGKETKRAQPTGRVPRQVGPSLRPRLLTAEIAQTLTLEELQSTTLEERSRWTNPGYEIGAIYQAEVARRQALMDDDGGDPATEDRIHLTADRASQMTDDELEWTLGDPAYRAETYLNPDEAWALAENEQARRQQRAPAPKAEKVITRELADYLHALKILAESREGPVRELKDLIALTDVKAQEMAGELELGDYLNERLSQALVFNQVILDEIFDTAYAYRADAESEGEA